MIRYHARWVLPVGAPAVRDGTVVVDGACIAWVGPRAALPAAMAGTDEELGDAILMPGLVNAHIHLDLAAFAGALDGLPFFAWVRTLVRGLRETMGEEALAEISRWSVADQLAHGVTTMGHTGPSRVAFDAIREMGARGLAFLEVFGPDPAECAASLAGVRARVDAARRDETPLVRIGVSPHAPYSVSDALYAAVAGYARDDALPLAVHIAESADESRLVSAGEGEFAHFLSARGIRVAPRAVSPVALLERMGVLATGPLCIHVVRADADDILRLGGSGARVAHCPRANAWFGHGTAPVRELRRAGIAVGLGTDSIASNEDVRLLAEARDAADESLAPSGRLELATLGGARALWCDDVVGILAPGMDADLAAFAIDDPIACDQDPARYLLQQCAAAPSLVTIVAGVVRARHGRALALHGAGIARVDRHRARVHAWVAGLANASDPILDSQA